MTPEQFKAHREAIGLTQEQLAHRLELTTGTISGYERGIRPVPKSVSITMKLWKEKEEQL